MNEYLKSGNQNVIYETYHVSAAYAKWNYKYPIVFVPKYRRKIVCRQLKRDIANILRIHGIKKRQKVVGKKYVENCKKRVDRQKRA